MRGMMRNVVKAGERKSVTMGLLRRAVWTESAGRALIVRAAFAGMTVAAVASPTLAGPEGARVARGDVNITRNGNETIIRASNNSIINYRSFDIGRGEAVRFIQPGSTSRVLNRIESARPTRIDGSLSANGRVYFMNPAGVYFGQGAVIDVAGLYAGAAKITDKDFIRNVDHFKTTGGAVVNEGTITADFAALIGSKVSNTGTITSNRGTVVMASGKDVLIGEAQGNIYVRVRGPASDDGMGGVNNGGEVRADGGCVVVGVGDVIGRALFNNGRIKAKEVRLEGQGKGVVEVGGTIDVSSADGPGGKVEVLGQMVALRDVHINASGATGGGEVLIGGAFQGKGPQRNAEKTLVTTGSTINADATSGGAGGTVIIWSDQSTRFNGRVSTRGGESGGAGGFVEVSGKAGLEFNGIVDVGARSTGFGHGTLLLDPQDITVISTGTSMRNDVNNFGDPGASLTISNAALNAMGGGNVILQANRDITIIEAINITDSGASLTMQAGRSIIINNDITTNNGAIFLTANEVLAAGVVNAQRTGEIPAAITFDSGTPRTINAGNANITITINTGLGLTNNASANITLENLTTTGHVLVVNNGPTAGSSIVRQSAASLITAASAALDVSSSGGAVGTSAAPIRLGVTNAEARASGGGVFLNSPSGGLTIGGATLGGLSGISAAGASAIGSDGAVTIAESIANTGFALSLNATSGGFSQNVGTTISASQLTLGGAGDFALDQSTNNVTSLIGSVDGTISFQDADTLTIGSAGTGLEATGASHDIAITTAGALTLAENIQATRNILINSGGGVSQTGGAITSTGLRITSSGGPVTLTQSGNDVGTLAASVTGSMSYTNTDGFEVGTVSGTVGVTTTAALSLTARGAGSLLTITDAVSAGTSTGTFTADDMAIGASVTAGAGVSLTPFTGTRNISLGTANAGELSLDSAELALISASAAGSALSIGATTGTITVRSALDLSARDYSLTLNGRTIALNFGLTVASGEVLRLNLGASGGGSVTQAAAITAPTIELAGSGTFTINNGGNNADTIRGNFTGLLDYQDVDDVAVGSAGLTSNNNHIFIGASGALAIGGNISAGTGVILINAAGVTQSAGAVTGSQMRITSSLGLTMDQTGNDVDSLSFSVAGNASYTDADDIATTNFGGVNGLTTTGGGNLTLTSRGGTGINVAAGSGITSAGALTLIGDSANIASAVSGQMGVFLRAFTASRNITLGAEVAGTLSFTNTELGFITSPGDAITFGTSSTNVLTTTNAILADNAVFNAISFSIGGVSSGSNRLTLALSGGTATQTGSISGDALRLTGTGTFTLSNASNDIATLAGNVTGAVSYVDANGFAVGTLTDIGLTTTGAVSLTSRGGTGLAVNQVVNAGASTVDLIADAMALNAAVTGNTSITLRPFTAGASMGIGNGAAGTLAINDAGIANLNSTGSVIFGNGASGLLTTTSPTFGPTYNVTFNGNGMSLGTITLGGTRRLTLNLTGGLAEQTVGGSIVVPNLLLTGAGSFNLTSALNDVDNLAGLVAGSVGFTDLDGLSVTTVGSTVGLSVTGGGSIGIETGDVLTLAQSLSAAGGSISLAPSAGGVSQTGGAITTGVLSLSGAGTYTLTSATNNIDAIRGNVVGEISYRDADGFTVGSGGVGLQSNNNTITLHSGAAGVMELARGIAAGTGDVLIQADGGLTQTGGGISASGLRINATGDVDASSLFNDVDVFAANVTGALSFADTDGFTTGTVGGVAGVTSTDELILNGVTNITVALGAPVDAGGSSVTLIANSMTLNDDVSADTGIDLRPFTAGRSMGVGTGATGDIVINNTMIARLMSSGVVTFGSVNTGTVMTSGAIFGSGYHVTLFGADIDVGGLALGPGRTLTLRAETGGVSQSSAITATNLLLLGNGAFALTDGANDFGTVAGNVNGAIDLVDTNTLTIGSLTVGSQTTNGLSSGGNPIIIGTTGLLTLSSDLSAVASDVTLGAGGGVNQTAGSLNALRLQLLNAGAGDFLLTSATNNIGTVSADVNGTLNIRDTNDLIVGAFGVVGVRTHGFDAAFTTGGSLTISQAINAGAGNVLLNAAGATQTANIATITAAGLRLSGTGDFTLTQPGNNVGTFASNATGAIAYRDIDMLAIGTVGGVSGIAAGTGSVDIRSNGALMVNEDISAATSVFLCSGLSGTGDLSFGAGVDVSSASITLTAGDGTGGGETDAIVNAVTNAPSFRGAAMGATNPTTFTIRQDGALFDTSTAPAAAQFGAGNVAGLNYFLQSDDSGIAISSASRFADSNLTLTALQGSNISVALAPRSFMTNSILALSADLVSSMGDVILGQVIVNGSMIRIGACGGHTLHLNGTVNAGSGTLTLQGDEIDINALVSGTGALRIEPCLADASIEFGNTISTALNLSAAEIAFLADGFTSITIGRSDGTGTITVSEALTFKDPTTLLAPMTTGRIVVNQALIGTGNASFTLDSGPSTTFLGADIITSGGVITIMDDVVLTSNVLLDTTNLGAAATGASVSISGTINDMRGAGNVAHTLQIRGGTGGDVTIAGAIGGTTGQDFELASLNISGMSITLGGEARTLGAQTYGGAASFSNNLTITQTGASLTVNGDVLLLGNVVVRTGGLAGDNITINGAVDSSVNDRDFQMNAGLGSINVTNDMGATLGLASFSATGSVISTQGVFTAGAVDYIGQATVGGNVRGTNVRFHDIFVAGADMTIDASSSAQFDGAVRSLANQFNDLTVVSPATTFRGAIGDIADQRLGALTTDAGGLLTFESGTISTVGAQRFGDAVNLNATSNFISDTSIRFDSTINSTGASAVNLTVSTPGEAFFGGAVGQPNNLGIFAVNNASGSARFAGGTVRTTGSQTYSGSVVLDTDTLFFGDGVRFFGTIDSGMTAPSVLTINGGAAGASFGGFAGNVRALGGLDVTGPVRITADSLFNTANTTNGGGDIRFRSTVDADASPVSLTLIAGAGAVVFSGNVGATTRLSDITASGASVSLQNVLTTGSQLFSAAGSAGITLNSPEYSSNGTGSIVFDGAVTLASDITVTTAAGDVLFGGSVDSSSGNLRNLFINTGGNGITTFRQAVGVTDQGGLTRLRRLQTNNDGTTRFEGLAVSTSEDMVFNSPVVLGNDVTFTGASITFSAGLDSDGIARAATFDTSSGVSGNARLVFAGAVGQASRLERLTTLGTGITRIGAGMATRNGMTFGGPVRIAASSTLDGGTGVLFFRGAIDSEVGFGATSLTLLSDAPANENSTPFRFGASIGLVNPLGGLRIGADLSQPGQFSTAVISDAWDSMGRLSSSLISVNDAFTILVAGDFTMGAGQKLLALGGLTISTRGDGSGANRTARLGDITSLNTISIFSDRIVIVTRDPGSVRNNNLTSSTQDGGVDLVAPNGFNFSVRPRVEGGGAVGFGFSNPDFEPTAQFGGFALRRYNDGLGRTTIDPSLFLNLSDTAFSYPLDLAARGDITISLATSLAGAIPRDTQQREVGTAVTISNALRPPLEEMGVVTRDLGPDESIEFLVGRSLYKDVPGTTSPVLSDYRIAINRLQSGPVQIALESYRDLVYFSADRDGNPYLDDTGAPTQYKEPQRIREKIAAAWDGYATAHPDATGAAFRSYLERPDATPEEVAALELLDRVRVVLDNMAAMGLAEYETRIPQIKLLNSIKPETMDMDTFREAVGMQQLAAQ